MSLLNSINCLDDIKKLNVPQLPILAEEVRRRIIEVVSCCGGHLASSLGSVEIIIALHYCFDLKRDKVIFDVGHQAYAHKILTLRNKDFHTLRQYQGISGFPCKDESGCDPFTTGHSSTAVSLALGLACARDLSGARNNLFKVVAVIGDGSLSGGVCFEGLNNAGHLKKDMLVVLNTNELSIAPNVGAISTYLNKIISLPIYNRFRDSLESFIRSRMPKGSRLIKLANKFEEGLKGLFVPGILFEELGFRYFGPFDGHDLNVLVKTFKSLINMRGPILCHVVTKKGKGYLPAEENPVKFHGIPPFDVLTGKVVGKELSSEEKTYTQLFGEELVSLAKEDEKIIAITAAMPEGTGLDKFRDAYPARFFDVGIAEEHAVCFAVGLAKEGFRPVVAVYSTFLQRAYDQMIEDVALQNLGVVFAIDRAGIVGEDGVTHQGIFDICYLRSIPNLVIMAPKDGPELKKFLAFSLKQNIPVAIRYPKAAASLLAGRSSEIEVGKAEVLREGKDFCVIALGSMCNESSEAMDILDKEGLKGALVNARFVKPLDKDLFKGLSRKHKFVFTVEEGVLDGGFGSAVMEAIDMPLVRIGLPCSFIPHGKREFLLNRYGLDAEGIAAKIKAVVWQK